jgi:NADP-dependent 3-hydroxy acid dehydrogenase YdfG
MRTPRSVASRHTRSKPAGSPAWKPQATLALVTMLSMASSSPSCQTPKPSPKSALRSIEATIASLRPVCARSFWAVTIDGKVVAVTGASSGIGEATALLLAERGAKLVLGARNPDGLDAVAARLTATGGDAIAKVTDVSCREDLTEFVALAAETYGQLDVLVSNAGIMPVSQFDELRVDDWEAMVDVNLKGVLFGIAAALPVFRRQGFGHFVNIASTAAFRVTPGQSVYAGTKMAVRAISEGLRQEAGENLRVTIVSPGMTSTNFAESITHEAARAELERRRDDIAMPANAVARAIAFAIDQPADVDIGEVVVRPTAQA